MTRPRSRPASWTSRIPITTARLSTRRRRPTRPKYGFDPGDEPVDDEQPAVRESSEEQALRLLKEHLGAERID